MKLEKLSIVLSIEGKMKRNRDVWFKHPTTAIKLIAGKY